ncbi:MAG: SPOR domain-containing protein [Candidatus Zixiibacteriota bacterium]
MRSLKMLLLAGLMLAVTHGCSEKQKEAARLEQEVRDLEANDSASLDPSASSAETTAQAESDPAQSAVADPAALPPEVRPQPETKPEPPSAVETSRPVESPGPMPPAPSGGGYTVQIASSETPEYARYLVSVYTERGYQPFVTTITYDNRTYYRVRVGQFKSVAEATVLMNELVDRFSIQPWIDRIE